MADREVRDGPGLMVRGLAVPALLAGLLVSGRWRHPGDDVLSAVVLWFEEPLHFLQSPAAMQQESHWLYDPTFIRLVRTWPKLLIFVRAFGDRVTRSVRERGEWQAAVWLVRRSAGTG